MRISDCSSDVCSSDLAPHHPDGEGQHQAIGRHPEVPARNSAPRVGPEFGILRSPVGDRTGTRRYHDSRFAKAPHLGKLGQFLGRAPAVRAALHLTRSEEHTSELQSLMRISYAVFCLKKKKTTKQKTIQQEHKYREK